MEQEEKKNYTTIADLENLAKEKYIELLKQGKLTDILDTMAKFPNITIDNDVLVMTQMPEATKIDMKEVWENIFNVWSCNNSNICPICRTCN